MIPVLVIGTRLLDGWRVIDNAYHLDRRLFRVQLTGHLEGNQAVDILYDGIGIHPFIADKLDAKNNHGTGCTFTAALTAYYAKGFEIGESIVKAKYFVHNALTFGLDIGKGPGPVNPFWNL